MCLLMPRKNRRETFLMRIKIFAIKWFAREGKREILSRGREPVTYVRSRGRKSESIRAAYCISEREWRARQFPATRHGNVMTKINPRRSRWVAFLFASRCKRADGGTMAFPTTRPFRSAEYQAGSRYFYKQRERSGTTSIRPTLIGPPPNCFYILGCFVAPRGHSATPSRRVGRGMRFPRAHTATGITSISEMNAKRYSLVAAHSSRRYFATARPDIFEKPEIPYDDSLTPRRKSSRDVMSAKRSWTVYYNRPRVQRKCMDWKIYIFTLHTRRILSRAAQLWRVDELKLNVPGTWRASFECSLSPSFATRRLWNINFTYSPWRFADGSSGSLVSILITQSRYHSWSILVWT